MDSEVSLHDEVMSRLVTEGYEVISAEDSTVGVQYAIRHQPDLIVCDVTLPPLDGFSVLLEIRANPVTMGIPFIFLTTVPPEKDKYPRLPVDTVHYLTKPFTDGEFLQAIYTRLEKKVAQERDYQQEIMQLEQALVQEHEKRLVKTKLTAMFAHDFRGSITVILSSNGLLRDYADRMDASRRQILLNRVDAAAQQLIQMLDEMLLLARIESGNLDFKPQMLNVGELLQVIVEEFQAIYSETYHILFENYFPGIMNADPRLLRQIATNLLSNAIKYSPHESEVRVTLHEYEKQLILTVQDHGIGIPEADQIRLFRDFERATNVGTIQGTGLGLAIVKQAVDFHGGSIHLQSKVDTGTTITVKIPIHQR